MAVEEVEQTEAKYADEADEAEHAEEKEEESAPKPRSTQQNRREKEWHEIDRQHD